MRHSWEGKVPICVAKYRQSQVLFLSLQASHFSKLVVHAQLLRYPWIPYFSIAARCPTEKLAMRLMGEICEQEAQSKGTIIYLSHGMEPNRMTEGDIFNLPSNGLATTVGTLAPWICDLVLPRFSRPFAYVENQAGCFFASAPGWTEVCKRVLQNPVASDKLTPDEERFLRHLTSDMANPAEAHQACSLVSLVRITPAVPQLPDYSGLKSLQPIVDVSRVIHATVPAPIPGLIVIEKAGRDIVSFVSSAR